MLIAAIGALGSNFQESQQITGIFIFVAAIPMMFFGAILTNPNAMVVRALSWFPLTAPTSMMLRLPLGEVPWIDIAGSIGVLLATIPLVVWLGAKIFRLGDVDVRQATRNSGNSAPSEACVRSRISKAAGARIAG